MADENAPSVDRLHNDTDRAPIKTSDLYDELFIISMCCGTDRMHPPLPSAQEWREIVLMLLPQDIDYVGSKAWLRQHPERLRGYFGMRASQLCRDLDKADDYDAEMHKWRLALRDRRERMLQMLLTAELPPLWAEQSADPAHPI